MLKRAHANGYPLNKTLKKQLNDKTVKLSDWKDEISDAKRWLAFKITARNDKQRKKLISIKRGTVLNGFPIKAKQFKSMQSSAALTDEFFTYWKDYKKEDLPKVKKYCQNDPTCVRRHLAVDKNIIIRKFI